MILKSDGIEHCMLFVELALECQHGYEVLPVTDGWELALMEIHDQC